MSIFNATFNTSQILAAAQITNDQLQSWVKRKLIIGQRDGGIDMPGKPGIRRTYSFFNLIEIAMGAEMIRLGVGPTQAFLAAGHYAHTGGSMGSRLPSLPFPGEKRTLLFQAGDRSVVLPWVPGSDLIPRVRTELMARSFLIIDASDIFDTAMAAVGQHPQAVMDQAYGGAG